MVDLDAVVESAFLIEVDDVLDRVGGRLFASIFEGAAVAEGREPRSVTFVEPEEAAYSEAVEPVALRERYGDPSRQCTSNSSKRSVKPLSKCTPQLRKHDRSLWAEA